jgi:23S rRNA (cytidine1920-2'-O)/16S rRNA (cytidine1409-2'-O)-methyltransferase
LLKRQKFRLDELLIKRGLAANLKEASALIISGKIHNNSKRMEKPGELFYEDIEIIRADKKGHPWVSRGGIKLKHAIDFFQIKPKGLIAMDVGCSTGGFTDVLLNEGVEKIFAVDVGYGELAWKLRNDDRVVLLERTNAKNLTESQITQPVDLIVCDASFISLKSVLITPISFLKDGGIIITLIKPQFEAKPSQVVEGGIITDPAIHEEICNNIIEWWKNMGGYDIIGTTESPIKGAEGNREFLICVRKNAG